ncbi:hypothetical protein FSP39_012993 [Pinctada imbricata]|uniref:Uncharacterized protein n=1 Tax=Pinctada imbricata TaxID=66713 RepID=A0AA89C1C7_PINIB|nr:hypothetical protein FSP39_012993 [Pinctada imbricata]
MSRTPPKHSDGKSDRTPPNLGIVKSERLSPPRGIVDSYTDKRMDAASEEESMDTDSYSAETRHAEVNHVFHHHSSSAKSSSQTFTEKSHQYDSMDDSQDGWSSPARQESDPLNGKQTIKSRDSTPEMDSLHDRNYSLGREGLQNGMNRTPIKTEEMGEV